MGKPINPPGSGEGIDRIDLKEALEERYLAYALSTIMHRALPDARDGLKPVHRRILHAMRLLRLDPGAAYKKCARIVGDVIGKYHPHGDQSVYDALVRLAQDFAERYPLVDGQGNFGNIDGDNAAAYRYTEARLTEVARLLLDGIDEDAVDFRDTYNGEDDEPIVLPAAFPNLLANGSTGIAVGMATSIPPHNAAELCDAALYLITHPNATSEQLVNFVPGPDFPTGGIIVELPASMLETYRTGRGGFRVRSRWHKEDAGRGTWNVVVTEIPYGVAKSSVAIASACSSRECLLDTHHLLEKPAVHPVGWQQRQDAIPVQQVVIQAAAYQPQHVQKRVVVPGDHAPRYAHHPAELAIDRRIDLTRKRKREWRGDTAVTFDDVAVVPDDGRRVLIQGPSAAR